MRCKWQALLLFVSVASDAARLKPATPVRKKVAISVT